MKTANPISGKRRIFNLLRSEKTLSRAALAQRCDLTRPAVSTIIDELQSEGLVHEIGRGDSTGGKPPILLSLVPGARCALGIELGDDRIIRAVLCDVGCRVLATDELEYVNEFCNILAVCGELARRLIPQAPTGSLIGIGVAVSGVVDSVANEVIGASTLDIVKKNLARELFGLTSLPVTLERRPNAAALAESLFGAGRECDDLVYITSGRGVGAGVVLNGEIHRGHHGTSGEIGQLLLPNGGRLELTARPGALAEALSMQLGRKVRFDEFVAMYRAGDCEARKLTERNAEEIAYAAQVAANMFDPEAIILGGQVLEFGDGYFAQFKRFFEAGSAANELGRSIKVFKSYFGSAGVAVGGAQVVLNEIVR